MTMLAPTPQAAPRLPVPGWKDSDSVAGVDERAISGAEAAEADWVGWNAKSSWSTSLAVAVSAWHAELERPKHEFATRWGSRSMARWGASSMTRWGSRWMARSVARSVERWRV